MNLSLPKKISLIIILLFMGFPALFLGLLIVDRINESGFLNIFQGGMDGGIYDTLLFGYHAASLIFCLLLITKKESSSWTIMNFSLTKKISLILILLSMGFPAIFKGVLIVQVINDSGFSNLFQRGGHGGSYWTLLFGYHASSLVFCLLLLIKKESSTWLNIIVSGFILIPGLWFLANFVPLLPEFLKGMPIQILYIYYAYSLPFLILVLLLVFTRRKKINSDNEQNGRTSKLSV